MLIITSDQLWHQWLGLKIFLTNELAKNSFAKMEKKFSLDIALYASYFEPRKNDKLMVPGLTTRDKEHHWLCLLLSIENVLCATKLKTKNTSS